MSAQVIGLRVIILKSNNETILTSPGVFT